MLLRCRLAGRIVKTRQLFLPPPSRHFSWKAPTLWKTNPKPVEDPTLLPGQYYTHPTRFTTDFFIRFFKFSLVGVLIVGVTTGTAYGITHMWVERVELAPELDKDVLKWGWLPESWSGGDSGGTDSSLGFKGRHAVRSAWMAHEWGAGSGRNVIGSKAFDQQDSRELNMVEPRLDYAQNFLEYAINVAAKKQQSGVSIPSEVLNSLTVRHANVLELKGSKAALFDARADLEQLWKNILRTGVDAALTAHKLGDLNNRLGDPKEALAWWSRAIQLVCGEKSISETPPAIPEGAPESPLAQRTLISTLISLSTYYAITGQLRPAQKVQESSLNLLGTITQPDSLSSATPPQALHGLFILHRSALLSIHLAEVLHGLRKSKDNSLQWLAKAAESSERVAISLMGLPQVHPDAPNSKIPHPPSSEAPLIELYSKSRSMRKPASSLLRDARRSAAEAWHLIGLLTEGPDAASAAKAVECYERALGWAGVAAEKVGGIGKAGEGTLESEWQVLWKNYLRARDKSRKT